MNAKVSGNVIRRLPRYLRVLNRLEEAGVERTSSGEISRMIGSTASQVRQDLSSFGEFGVQGYGYNIENLRNVILSIMGADRGFSAILVGYGSLGKSLIQNFCFEAQGITLKAIFDRDSERNGTDVKGIPVYHADEMEAYLQTHDIDMAVVAVSKSNARDVTNHLIKCGIHAFWNFTNEELVSPDNKDVIVENVHFSDSLLALSYYLADKKDREKQ